DEIAERGTIEQAMLDRLPRFGKHARDVRNVPVSDVRAEDRPQAGPERMPAGIAGDRRQAIAGLAAEVEALREEADEVLRLLHPRGRELVERGAILVRLAETGERFVETLASCADGRRAVARDERLEQRPIEPPRVVALDRVPVALLPVSDEPGVQGTGPPRPAFQEREAQAREPMRHA